MRKHRWTPEELERYRKEEEARPHIYAPMPPEPLPREQKKPEEERGVWIIEMF